MARRHARPTKIQQQVKALQMRVSFLERALRPAKKAAKQPAELGRTRERAEEEARYNAKDLAREREIADFMRSRGLKPDPSSIPAQFHRGLKGYQPPAAKTTSD